MNEYYVLHGASCKLYRMSTFLLACYLQETDGIQFVGKLDRKVLLFIE